MERTPSLTEADPQVLASIGCILAATLCFSLGDMAMKLVSETEVPLHQAVALRSAIALVLTLVFLRRGAPLSAAFRTGRPWMHLGRGFAVLLSNLTYFAALAALPLATTSAIFFVAPMLIVAGSAVFAGDRVGPVRWAALAVGFAGVLLVIRPGSPAFTWLYVLPLLSAAAYAAMQTVTRRMGGSESSLSLAVYAQLSFLAGSLVLALILGDGRFAGSGSPAAEFLLRPWVWPGPREAALIGFMGVTIAGGLYLLGLAYRMTEAGIVAPFEYSSLVLAVIWGVLFWGQFPDRPATLGIALIVGSGVLIALREARAGRRRPSAARVVLRR